MLLENELLDKALFATYEDDLEVEIMHGDQVISRITKADAEALGKNKNDLAKEYVAAIKTSYARHASENNNIRNLTRTGLLILIFITIFLLVKFINKGFNKLIDFILHKWQSFFKGIKIKNIEILSAEREEKMFFLVMRATKIFLIILLLYLSLPIIFSIFPGTKGLATTLLAYIISPVRSIL